LKCLVKYYALPMVQTILIRRSISQSIWRKNTMPSLSYCTSENIDALQRFAEVEGLTQHVNTEIQRLQSRDDRIDLAAGSAFQDAGVSPRLLIEVGQHILDGAKGHAQQKGLDNVETRLESGDPADRILHCIDDENIDCVVMGSRGLSNVKGLFLGSVSHKVANHAACTCITVK